LVNCEFEDPADFSYSAFKRHLILQNSTFKQGFDLEGATIDLNGRFDAIKVLSGKAGFRYLHVQGLLNLEHAQFDSAVTANFSNAHIDKGAYLRGIVFGGDVLLTEMRIGGDLVLTDAHFKKAARFATTKVGGSLFLESAQFDGPVGLVGVETAYSIKLPKATFQKQALFTEIEVKSFLDLSGAKFEWPGEPARFGRAHVVGGGGFDNVHFAGGARFDNAHFNGDASFENTVFDALAQFNKAHFDQTAHFETCMFKKDAFFNETSFGTVDFAQTGAVMPKDAEVNDSAQIKKERAQDQFQGRLDLRGSTYRRIQLHWQSALRMPDGTPRLMGNDQQPYSELEKFLKDTGDDDGADGVSLQWHRLKRQEMFHSSKLDWLFDCISWFLTNYGVAPARLLNLTAILLIFGMLIFSLPGAVTGGEGKPQQAEPLAIGKDTRLSHWDAFALSFHEFLPLDVPFGSRWTPGNEPVRFTLRLRKRVLNVVTMRPSTCATLLKIGGYILVPLQILIVNGLIRGGQLP
ncbi:MAG TPA: pentapeptide repeat-containing protein, partial [Terriglobales bacterium]|nr:pentapeptide repeat-containing protein [Terriglobales bacterium]